MNEEQLPEAYFSLALLHAVGGMALASMNKVHLQFSAEDRRGVPEQVNYFDALRLDRRCSRDISLRTHTAGRCMFSAELLSFGTGMLRARNDDRAEPIHRYLWAQFGRLHTRQERIFARIVSLHRVSNGTPDEVGKESFDSTNVIYGDAYGELEQLWARRADTTFLEQVAKSLQPMRRRSEPAIFLHPPNSPLEILKLHLRRQAVWKAPPVSARSLLHRIEYILDRTTLDSSATTIFSEHRSAAPSHSHPQASHGRLWEADSSGYDGWLTDAG